MLPGIKKITSAFARLYRFRAGKTIILNAPFGTLNYHLSTIDMQSRICHFDSPLLHFSDNKDWWKIQIICKTGAKTVYNMISIFLPEDTKQNVSFGDQKSLFQIIDKDQVLFYVA